jgi:integrase
MNKKGNICKVEPIRDKVQIDDMKCHLKINNIRDWLLFTLGINSGLRISDLLKLTVEDVSGEGTIVREKKTQKVKSFLLSNTCQRAIKEYLEQTGIISGTLFPSKKDKTKPITSRQAWHILKEAAEFVGITGNIGTHTLRKTFGYWAFKQGVDPYYIMRALNHSSLAITKIYIGIEQEELDENVYKKMNL